MWEGKAQSFLIWALQAAHFPALVVAVAVWMLQLTRSCQFELFTALRLVTSPPPPVLQFLPCKMGIIAIITSKVGTVPS